MRNIIFRGIDADRNIWLYGFLSWKDYNGKRFSIDNLCGFHSHSGYNGKRFFINNLRVLASTVGQFTGLTDIEGKRIFEKDIVEFNGDRYVVEWDNYNCHYILSNDEVDELDLSPILNNEFVETTQLKVVGNIFQLYKLPRDTK